MNDELKDAVPKSDSWHKEHHKGVYITDYQAEILKRNGINPNASINFILMDINNTLLDGENEELEQVAKELDEMNYYNSKRN